MISMPAFISRAARRSPRRPRMCTVSSSGRNSLGAWLAVAAMFPSAAVWAAGDGASLYGQASSRPIDGPGLRANAGFLAPSKPQPEAALHAGDRLSGSYRLLREKVADDPNDMAPMLVVWRDGDNWLFKQSGTPDSPQRLLPLTSEDYDAMLGEQRQRAKPQCAASSFTAICRFEPGTKPDPDINFRTRTGYIMFSSDVGMVELERVSTGTESSESATPPVPAQ